MAADLARGATAWTPRRPSLQAHLSLCHCWSSYSSAYGELFRPICVAAIGRATSSWPAVLLLLLLLQCSRVQTILLAGHVGGMFRTVLGWSCVLHGKGLGALIGCNFLLYQFKGAWPALPVSIQGRMVTSPVATVIVSVQSTRSGWCTRGCFQTVGRPCPTCCCRCRRFLVARLRESFLRRAQRLKAKHHAHKAQRIAAATGTSSAV